MNSFTLELIHDEAKKCTFYSVRKEGSSITEFEKFLNTYENDVKYASEINTLVHFIFTTIGDEHGALEEFVNRYEDWGYAFPPAKNRIYYPHGIFHMFPLRVYFFKISDRSIVLFGGGIKDARANKDAQLLPAFREANTFAKAIQREVNSGMLFEYKKTGKLSHLDEDDEIVIYM